MTERVPEMIEPPVGHELDPCPGKDVQRASGLECVAGQRDSADQPRVWVKQERALRHGARSSGTLRPKRTPTLPICGSERSLYVTSGVREMTTLGSTAWGGGSEDRSSTAAGRNGPGPKAALWKWMGLARAIGCIWHWLGNGQVGVLLRIKDVVKAHLLANRQQVHGAKRLG